MLKLFRSKIYYSYGEFDDVLLVAKNKDDAKIKSEKIAKDRTYNSVDIYIEEINQVDGFEILVGKDLTKLESNSIEDSRTFC